MGGEKKWREQNPDKDPRSDRNISITMAGIEQALRKHLYALPSALPGYHFQTDTIHLDAYLGALRALFSCLDHQRNLFTIILEQTIDQIGQLVGGVSAPEHYDAEDRAIYSAASQEVGGIIGQYLTSLLEAGNAEMERKQISVGDRMRLRLNLAQDLVGKAQTIVDGVPILEVEVTDIITLEDSEKAFKVMTIAMTKTFLSPEASSELR